MVDFDCIVIGAGVIGLAVARALAGSGRNTLIVEREKAFGTITSARNSEVIHAGIYYAPQSLKARFCASGREQLYRYCSEHQIDHRRCGKLIVATDKAQIGELEKLAATAAHNGVSRLHWLDAAQVRTLEPQLHCSAALLSPDTGILDTHTYMLALLGDAQAHGATLALCSPVARMHMEQYGIAVTFADAARTTLHTHWVLNCAGLDATRSAEHMEGFPAARIPRTRFAKGSYFTLQGQSPFSRLVYPVPEPGGLGVHLTLDRAGNARFGPDVEWLDVDETAEIDYRVDPGRGVNFYASIRRYWPLLRNGQLSPAYSGVRPKLSGPGEPVADFMIEGPSEHGIPGVVNLFGIESPGITASLSIAEHVREIVDSR